MSSNPLITVEIEDSLTKFFLYSIMYVWQCEIIGYKLVTVNDGIVWSTY